MSIKPLPVTIINQIQCSTALPDRFTIVKELLENSIDSCFDCECNENFYKLTINKNIHSITIDIKPGKISITDTGCGILPTDLLIIGRKNWTSKIPNELVEQDISTADISKDISTTDIGKTDISTTNIGTTNISKDIGTTDISTTDISTTDISTTDIGKDINTTNISTTDTTFLNNFFANPGSLGFRGEALTLIKECATVEIKSGCDGFAYSVNLIKDKSLKTNENQQFQKTPIKRIPYVKGTTVSISDIFEGQSLKQKRMQKDFKKENEAICHMAIGYFLSVIYDYSRVVSTTENGLKFKFSQNKRRCSKCFNSISFLIKINGQTVQSLTFGDPIDWLGNILNFEGSNRSNSVSEKMTTEFIRNKMLDLVIFKIKSELSRVMNVTSGFSHIQSEISHEFISNLSESERLGLESSKDKNNKSQTQSSKDKNNKSQILIYKGSSTKPVVILMVNGRYCRNKQIERLAQNRVIADQTVEIQSAYSNNRDKSQTDSRFSPKTMFSVPRTLVIFITTNLVDHNTEGKLEIIIAQEIINHISEMLVEEGVKSAERILTQKEKPGKTENQCKTEIKQKNENLCNTENLRKNENQCDTENLRKNENPCVTENLRNTEIKQKNKNLCETENLQQNINNQQKTTENLQKTTNNQQKTTNNQQKNENEIQGRPSIKLYRQEANLLDYMRNKNAQNQFDDSKYFKNQQTRTNKIKTDIIGQFDDLLYVQQNDQMLVCSVSDILAEYISMISEFTGRNSGTNLKNACVKTGQNKLSLDHVSIRSNKLLDAVVFLINEKVDLKYDHENLSRAFDRYENEIKNDLKDKKLQNKHIKKLKLALTTAFTSKNDLKDLFRFLQNRIDTQKHMHPLTDLKTIYKAVGR
ncbi:PMS1 protein like protein 1 [Pseudoloma neurophilia]|uniref:PMS1 protein like protein 1 n=1 Tax=Pseudoloma neurophilia TaxID=146866 RepID=A0A0R0M0V6_9MICR|nr:PMS1 protein like protein 1 [Pseudoloma neurophilia]